MKYVYRRRGDGDWEVGFHDQLGTWVLHGFYQTARQAAAAACKANGHEPDPEEPGLTLGGEEKRE